MTSRTRQESVDVQTYEKEIICMVFWLRPSISESIEYYNLLNYRKWADFMKLHVARCLCATIELITVNIISEYWPIFAACLIVVWKDLFIHVFYYSPDDLSSNAWCAFLVFRHRYHNRDSALWRGLPTNQGGLKRGHPVSAETYQFHIQPAVQSGPTTTYQCTTRNIYENEV